MKLLDLPPSSWPRQFAEWGARPFHGKSAARWVFAEGVLEWRAMTDLPVATRRFLAEQQPLLGSVVQEVARAGDGALKALLRLPDGAAVEAVSMPGTRGHTVCLSTQVGCPVQCGFCASGIGGVERNLAAGEIVEQALQLRREHGPFQRVVVMGMGDPGFNLPATLAALDSFLDPAGFALSARRVTLSTVAPRGALEQLAAWGRPITVALSLHAPDDALRHRLIPGLRKRGVAETLEEADLLFARTGREYTVEYVLLGGVNDAPQQAQALGRLLHGRRCHVNLIPYNPVAGLDFHRPPLAAQQAFAAQLRSFGLPVTLRRSLGGAAAAACGQLRRRSLPPPTTPQPAADRCGT